MVQENYYPLAADIKVYDGIMPYTDVLMATHWTTVEPALASARFCRNLVYFVQDFEPLFAPMGAEFILAENTYRMGLYCVTAAPWCAWRLQREFACEVDSLELSLDRDIYFPRPRNKRRPNLVFFAKPEVPRHSYELGVVMLRHLHRLMPELEIILYGSRDIDRDSLGFPATIQAPLPTAADLGQLYADADLGVVFSTTTPCRVPYEMMACATPVVDLARNGNEMNYGGRQDIALLADPRPQRMAEQIQALLRDAPQRAARSAAGLEFVAGLPTDEQMVRRLEQLLLARLAKTGFPR
jgi:glycosyltransferase involved in cell wall biosynthesis